MGIASEQGDLQAEFLRLLTDHVPNLRVIGTKATGSVPWRTDEHPSFSADMDKAVWYDLARKEGGGVKDFKARLGLHGTKPKEIVATYDYQDESGTLLYQVVRYPHHQFSQRRPDGKGGWIYNLTGVRRVLYHLPELQDVSTIYVCEGEKDADRLWSLGLPATTNPQGAGKWLGEYNQTFAQKHAVVLLDNDQAGEKHGQEVNRNLMPVAITVKNIRFPDLPNKGDVSDWLNAGHTKDELVAIVDATPVCQMGDPPRLGNGHDLSDEEENRHIIALEREICPPEYPCPDILWQGVFSQVADLVDLRDWRVWLGTLAALSARAHRNLHTAYYGPLYGMGYYLLVAPSSQGKSLCTRLMKALLPPNMELFTSVESGQALAESLAEIVRDDHGKIAAIHPRPAACVVNEWSILLQNMDFHGSSLMERFCEICDAEQQVDLNRADKQGKGKIRVPNPSLTLLGTTTIQRYQESIKPRHISSGFINRHLILPGQRMHWLYDSPGEYIDFAGLRDYAASLPLAHALGQGQPVSAFYTDEAKALDIRFGMEVLEPLHNEETELEDLYKRLHVYNRRIALLYAWSTYSPKITPDHVLAAHTVIETALRFMRVLHADLTADLTPYQRSQADLEGKIVATVKATPGIRKEDISQRLKRHGGFTAVSSAIEKLIQSGILRLGLEGLRNKKRRLFLAN